MEMINYEKVNAIIDRIIGSWSEQEYLYGKLSLSTRICADNHYVTMRKKLTLIAEAFGTDFLSDLEVRIRTINEERAK